MDDAWVCTIGSMAARILRENAFEVGIDPKFEVIDEAEASYLRAEATEQVLAHLETGADPLRASRGHRRVRAEGAGALRQEALGAFPGGGGPGAGDARGVRGPAPVRADRHACAPCATGSGELSHGGSGGGEGLGKDECHRRDEFASDLETGIDRAEPVARCRYGRGTPLDAPVRGGAFLSRRLLPFPPASDKYRAKKPDADAFAAWRGAYASVFSEAQAALGARVSDYARRVARASLWRTPTPERRGERPTRSGRFAAPVLGRVSRHPELSERYRERFKVIMVDEFQDTDKLQVAVIAALAQPGFANVCTVGDAQQSIYRFRGADVNVFFEYRDRLRSLSPEAEFPQLPHNFRSHGDVLSLVDAVFGQPQVFGDEFLHLEAAGAVNTAADPVFEGDGPARIAVSVFQNDGSRATVSSEELSGPVRPRGGRALRAAEGGRRARPGEMALLLGTMTRASVYQAGAARCGLREHRDGRIGVRPERRGPTCGYAAARGSEPRRLRGASPGARLRSVRAFRRCSSRARHNGRLGVGKRRRRRR